MKSFVMLPLLAALMLLMSGCNGESDGRLADFAERSLAQQARQNELLAEQSKSLGEAAKRLVEHDSAARQELLAAQERVQTQLNEERTNLGQQFDQLEEERRLIAQQRIRDPMIAEAMKACSLTIACVLPLVLCWLVLRGTWVDSDVDTALGDILVTELVSDCPKLLLSQGAPQTVIEDQSVEGNKNIE